MSYYGKKQRLIVRQGYSGRAGLDGFLDFFKGAADTAKTVTGGGNLSTTTTSSGTPSWLMPAVLVGGVVLAVKFLKKRKK